jgi:hypothetical protein
VETLRVECLFCGNVRELEVVSPGHVAAGECSRCGYVGWAPSADLSERERRDLRERPPELRRPFPVAR